MFSGRRDRVWSDNSTHLFYCSQKPGCGNREETNRRILTNAGLTPRFTKLKRAPSARTARFLFPISSGCALWFFPGALTDPLAEIRNLVGDVVASLLPGGRGD